MRRAARASRAARSSSTCSTWRDRSEVGKLPLPPPRLHAPRCSRRAGLRQRVVAQHDVPRNGRGARRRALPARGDLGHALRRVRPRRGLGVDERQAEPTREPATASSARQLPSSQPADPWGWDDSLASMGAGKNEATGFVRIGGRARGVGLERLGAHRSVHGGLHLQRLGLDQHGERAAHLPGERWARRREPRQHDAELLRLLEPVRRRPGGLPRARRATTPAATRSSATGSPAASRS